MTMQTERTMSYGPEPPRAPPPALPATARPVEGVRAAAPGPEAVAGNDKPVKQDPRELKEAVAGAVRQMNDYIQTVNRDLSFSVDELSGKTVIKVIDAETKEVIRQIPPEEILALARHFAASGEGPVLIETKT